MAVSSIFLSTMLLLCFSSDAAGAPQTLPQHAEKEDMAASSPVILELERETRIVFDRKEKKNYYSALLSVGGPKPQEFRVGFDLGGGTTLLPSKDCKQDACLQRKQYNKCDSNMAEDVNRDGKFVIPGTPKICKRLKSFLSRDVGTLGFHSVELGEGSAKGQFVRDKVCINVKGDETRCFSFAFLAASIMTSNPFVAEPFDGIVGIGPGTGGILSNDFDFIYKIIHAVPTNTQGMFGLYLGHGKGGEMAIGGYDQKRLNSPISWVPVVDVDDGRWQVTISAFRVGNATLDFCSGNRCIAVLDYGTSLLSVPSSLEGKLEQHISSASPKHCQESAIPDLQLELGGMTVTVPVQDYSPSFSPITAKGYSKDGPCSPDLELHNMDADVRPGNHVFILGESVLRRYYTAYDTESKRVGFGLAATEDEEQSKKLRLKDDMSEAMPSPTDGNGIVILVQVQVTSRKTRSSLGLVEDLSL